jgi:hypothetical protein
LNGTETSKNTHLKFAGHYLRAEEDFDYSYQSENSILLTQNTEIKKVAGNTLICVIKI